jgi:hypothetical protein
VPIETTPSVDERHTADLPGLRTLVQGKPPYVTTTTDPIDLLASPQVFQTWLAGLEPSFFVGYSESIYQCPLATFLTACGVGAWVGHTVFGLGDDMDSVAALPKWAHRFVQLVDRYEYQPIRASLAMTLAHQAAGDTQ